MTWTFIIENAKTAWNYPSIIQRSWNKGNVETYGAYEPNQIHACGVYRTMGILQENCAQTDYHGDVIN